MAIALTQPLMDKQNLYPKDQFPTTDHLSAAIRKLPRPGPDVSPQTVEIDAGPIQGRFRVTFVPRKNPEHRAAPWFWGIESGERIQVGQAGSQELQDPD